MYLETTSGEGILHLATARVTSRQVRSGLRPLLATTITRGSFDPRPCSRIVFDCSAGMHRFRMPIPRDWRRRAPRKRGDATERSLGRSPRASGGHASMGSQSGPGSRAFTGQGWRSTERSQPARRSGSNRPRPLTRLRRKRSWRSRAQGFNHRREGATGSVRGKTGDLPPVEKAVGDGCVARKGLLIQAPQDRASSGSQRWRRRTSCQSSELVVKRASTRPGNGLGSQPIRRVLVAVVGCKHWVDASSLPGRRGPKGSRRNAG